MRKLIMRVRQLGRNIHNTEVDTKVLNTQNVAGMYKLREGMRRLEPVGAAGQESAQNAGGADGQESAQKPGAATGKESSQASRDAMVTAWRENQAAAHAASGADAPPLECVP
jgi:hypothetical protein